ncbi:MAG: hypothetical protein JRG91_21440, partial [Deltaproteobacteria bacterium]|nr:hypothetical protein [Deltaproteobacteria bacterium]
CAVAILALPAAGAGEDIDLYEEAAVQSFLGRPVGQVEFDPPMEDVEDPFQFFDIAQGAQVSHELVSRMIERMWLTGKVAEVTVLADDLPDGSVLMTVSYTHRLRFQSVSIKGNKKLMKKKILHLIGYRPDMELYPDTLAIFEDTLHKEYALRGFPHASFLLEIETLEELDEVKLAITVIEGIPYRIHDLDLGYAADDPLDGPVPLFELRNALGLRDGDIYDQLKLKKGLEAIEAKLHDAGYLNAEAGPVEPKTDEAGKLTLHIPVKAGPLLRFVIEGNEHLRDEDALQVLEPQRFLPLNAGFVEEMALRLVEHYQILGFLDASVIAQQKLAEDGSLLVYRFVVDEGPRVRVTKIRFKGNK